MSRAILGLFLLLSCFSIFAQDSASLKGKVESKPYVLPWTYEVNVPSAIQSTDYKLIIKFPAGYDKTEEGFPVIYILDGQYHYPLVSSAHGNYAWDGTIAKAITVGITWAGEDLNIEELRQLNFTPTVSAQRKPSGGANTFLRVLKEEIIPFVDKHYKTNKKRTLTGSSYSGLFALYAMVNEPELFENIIALSPSIWWGDRMMDQQIRKHFAEAPALATRLYVARGEYELYGMKPNDTLFHGLMGSNKGNVAIRYDVVEDAGHSGVNPQGFARGLRFVFGKNKHVISAFTKQKMVGKYTSDNKQIPEVELKSDATGLFFVDPMSNKIFIHSHSADEFYINEFNADLRFADIKNNQYQKVTVAPKGQGSIVYKRE